MNPFLNCLIVNPVENISVAMNLYCQFTGFLIPTVFTTEDAYVNSMNYLKDTPIFDIDIAVIDLQNLKEGMQVFEFLTEHLKNVLIILLADQEQLPSFSKKVINTNNALIVLKPSKFSFIVDWIRSHFSRVCKAETKEQCPYLISPNDKKNMPYTPIICTSCKFNY